MQHLWTCLLLAVAVRGTVASVGNGSALQQRVIGGQIVTNAELGGYMVTVTHSRHFICAGTLIHERMVLTSGQCVTRMNRKKLRVIGGLSKLTDNGEGRNVKDLMISPDFSQKGFNSDVAVLLLDKPLVGKDIGKLSLCTTKLKDGTPLVFSGWGQTSNLAGSQDLHLRSVTVPMIELNKCREMISKQPKHIIIGTELGDKTFCAGDPGSKDACFNDYGGPLVHNKEVCGIMTYGISCGFKTHPSVATDVLLVKPFIEKAMEELLKLN